MLSGIIKYEIMHYIKQPKNVTNWILLCHWTKKTDVTAQNSHM